MPQASEPSPWPPVQSSFPAPLGRGAIARGIDLLCGHLQGKEDAVRLAFIALLAGGHLLLEDLPGVGKTTLALALSRALGLSFGRIQCTSDILPSDITGLSIYNRQQSDFHFVPGPVFHHLVLVDEINRAMPRTQSALLEAMEERQVTVEGNSRCLPDPFLVIATQNPVDHVGTYPLPESQLDRFLLCTGIGYPAAEKEKEILRAGSIRSALDQIPAVLNLEDLLVARRSVQQEVCLGEKVIDYLFSLVTATRKHPRLLCGLSPRGGIDLAAAARSRAWLEGRDYVLPEDIKTMALPVGAHRLVLHSEHEHLRKEEVLRSILDTRPGPRV